LAEFEFPTVLLKQPVFIGTGTADVDVTPSMQEQLVKDACAAGSIVEAHLYKGLTHSQTLEASLRDSIPFVRRMFAGEPVMPVCSPNPE
jgi:predicted esterase